VPILDAYLADLIIYQNLSKFSQPLGLFYSKDSTESGSPSFLLLAIAIFWGPTKKAVLHDGARESQLGIAREMLECMVQTL
jgi:hypothetical protein